MKRKKPVLVITLQIPLTDDLSAEDVLEALRMQTEAALQLVRERMSEQSFQEDAGDALPSVALAGLETLEPFTEETKDNLLDRLGYREAE